MIKVLITYNIIFEENCDVFQNLISLHNTPWKEQKLVFVNSQETDKSLIISLPKKQKKYYYVFPNEHYSCVINDRCENDEEFRRFRNTFKQCGWQLVNSKK